MQNLLSPNATVCGVSVLYFPPYCTPRFPSLQATSAAVSHTNTLQGTLALYTCVYVL